MKKVNLIFIGVLTISIALAGCGSKTTSNATSKKAEVPQAANKLETTNNTTSTSQVASNKVNQDSNKIIKQSAGVSQSSNKSDKASTLNFEVITKTYVNKNVKINYPQIDNLSDINKQKRINDLIKNDILTFYKPEEKGTIIDANYEITWKSPKLISIVYKGVSSLESSMHPDHDIYVTNIDIEKETILKFKDIIRLDDNFAKKLKNVKYRVWTPKPLRGMDENKAIGMIGEILNSPTNKDLISYFDLPAYEYCGYFTKDYFVISIATSHAAGDYAELQIKYGDIKDNIKPENEVWKDFI